MVALEGKVEAKNSKLDDLYIDIGAADRAQAKAMVQIGDTAVYDTPAFRTGGRIFSPYLDDRIACVVLLMAMERLVKRENDLYFIFTVQEELGLRGRPYRRLWGGSGLRHRRGRDRLRRYPGGTP